MQKLFYILSVFLVASCANTKDFVHYQVTFETGNIKPSEILLKPLYQKKDNQCGALFLEGRDLTVINNFDTSQTFINLKYKYEKNSAGLYDTYTFEDVFLKKKEGYTILSSLRDESPVLKITASKIKVLDKAVEVIVKEDGTVLYIRNEKDAEGNKFTEIYSIKKTVLTSVTYDRYSFPCE